MSQAFSYQTTYILDKAYYVECYDDSVTNDDSLRPYTKASVLIAFALVIMIATEVSAYMSYFVFGLGIVEALGVFYRKPWWVTRQLLSKAANNEVDLLINEDAIVSKSAFVDLTFLWTEISMLTKSSKGWLFTYHGVKHYLSDRSLDESAQAFLLFKQAQLPAEVTENNGE